MILGGLAWSMRTPTGSCDPRACQCMQEVYTLHALFSPEVKKGLLNIQPASHPPGAVTASHLPEPTSSLLTLSVFAAAQHPSLVTTAPPSRVDYAVYIAPAWVSWATWVAWDAQATCAAATIHSTSIYHIFVHSSQPSISRKILNLQSFRANRTQVSVPCWG